MISKQNQYQSSSCDSILEEEETSTGSRHDCAITHWLQIGEDISKLRRKAFRNALHASWSALSKRNGKEDRCGSKEVSSYANSSMSSLDVSDAEDESDPRSVLPLTPTMMAAKRPIVLSDALAAYRLSSDVAAVK